jgi:hypothetical protein
MQAPVQRSSEVARAAENDSRRPDVLHQQFADRLQKEAQQSKMQVRESNKSEKGLVDKDGKKESQEQKRKRENEKKKAALSDLLEERRLLDIRI